MKEHEKNMDEKVTIVMFLMSLDPEFYESVTQSHHVWFT